jgi:hypothetical protein
MRASLWKSRVVPAELVVPKKTEQRRGFGRVVPAELVVPKKAELVVPKAPTL